MKKQSQLPTTEETKVSLEGFNALLDTGASSTCVAPELIKKANLKAIGKVQVHTASGVGTVNQYMCDVVLSFGGAAITFVDLKISEFAPPTSGHFHALLGMDIIRQGCLTVSFDGRFTFSV